MKIEISAISPMLRIMLILLVTSVLTYLGLRAALFFYQRSLIYFPQPSTLSSTATITLPTTEAQVHVTVKPHEGPNAIIYFGGNAENVNYNLPILSTAFPDHTLYLMNYRGYGQSTGKPSEEALIKDAVSVFDIAHVKYSHITIVGRSLGSGIAVHLASVRPADRLILITPYNSIQEIAQGQYPYFPIKWLLLDKYESWRYAPKVTVPTLILLAEHDDIIPRASSNLLYSHFKPGLAVMKVIANTDHNTINDSPQYIPLLKAMP